MKRQNLILLVLALVLSVLFSSTRQVSLQNSTTNTQHLSPKNYSYKSPAKPFLEHKQAKLKVRYKAGEVDYYINVPSSDHSFLAHAYPGTIYSAPAFFPLTGNYFIFYLRGPPAIA